MIKTFKSLLIILISEILINIADRIARVEGTFFCLRAQMKIMLKQERRKVSTM
jgi:hypothetical protein